MPGCVPGGGMVTPGIDSCITSNEVDTFPYSCFGLLLLLSMVCWKCFNLAFSTILLVLFRAILYAGY